MKANSFREKYERTDKRIARQLHRIFSCKKRFDLVVRRNPYLQCRLHEAASRNTPALTGATWHSRKTLTLLAHVFPPRAYTPERPCSFAVHMPEGVHMRIYSANGVRHRQYMFPSRIPFRVGETCVRFPPYSQVFLVMRTLATQRVSHERARWCRGPFNVIRVVCKNNPRRLPINFSKARAENYRF